ncbi:hypothetical protein [Candidatus Galacturonibacter soehngenii]|uniref:Discoidin domain-containing protein n=1 Tax=Candidatus Galacturonatibacter soehngenii TaxID=2307010 RepID=A0A7V7QJ38_9FIRM|nr:hypothetical protein [Candidatus Galacturonibacter soehngenii]KAB1437552.1 hypothetical protein F7O84_08060 [Candidatus Galacturonibacter soehngenii]
MKKLKKILCVLLILGFVLNFPNTVVKAEEIQYTENLIPKMTSNTSPSGKASASSVSVNSDGSLTPEYLAFDHSVVKTSCWQALNSKTGWLEYEFPENKIITKYTLQPRNWVEYIWQSPKDWTFEAYDEEEGTWVVLDTQTNITDWNVSSKKEFTLENTNSYLKYRINVSSIVDNPSAKYPQSRTITIGELEMMETVPQGANATIYITMVTGEIKEYHVDSAIKQDYLLWYDNRSNGSGKAYYTFAKATTGGFVSRNEYLSFDKISSFEIMEYN